MTETSLDTKEEESSPHRTNYTYPAESLADSKNYLFSSAKV